MLFSLNFLVFIEQILSLHGVRIAYWSNGRNVTAVVSFESALDHLGSWQMHKDSPNRMGIRAKLGQFGPHFRVALVLWTALMRVHWKP